MSFDIGTIQGGRVRMTLASTPASPQRYSHYFMHHPVYILISLMVSFVYYITGPCIKMSLLPGDAIGGLRSVAVYEHVIDHK